MKTYFITGTDTDCGKTYVTCQLLDYLNSQQRKTLALKPIASGCKEENGQLKNDDILNLQRHNYSPEYTINKWQFAAPIAPHLAAKNENCSITLEALANFCQDKQFRHLDKLLVEGAGGLMVPLNNNETWVDFLKLTEIPVIIVVGMRLGCINHALLTATVLKFNKISCAGWIANCLDQNMLALNENIATLVSIMPAPHLATIPYQGKLGSISL